MVFRTSGTWPRTNALYCHPVPAQEWPQAPDIVERAGLRSCVRRGAAIDLVLDRGRENRSQIVFTKARGRDAVFWQSARTRKQARPNVTTPSSRAAGFAELEIVVDSHEQYAYRFLASRSPRSSGPCPAVTTAWLSADDSSPPSSASPLLTWWIQPDQRKAPLRAGRIAALPALRRSLTGTATPSVFKPERVRPALVADGQPNSRSAGPGPDGLLRNPPPRRGMDLPVPGRRPRRADTETASAERLTPRPEPHHDRAGPGAGRT